MKIKLFAAAASTLVVALSSAAAAQAAEPTVCAGTIQNQVVADVEVPYLGDCTLRNVIVLGDVDATIDSGALVLDRAVVSGDVRSDAGGPLTVTSTVVRGGIDALESRGDVVISRSAINADVSLRSVAGAVRLGDPQAQPPQPGNVFRGDVTIQNALSGGSVARNVFAQDLSLTGNGAFTVSHNLVRGTLACEGNEPAPALSGNSAGQQLGQCAAS